MARMGKGRAGVCYEDSGHFRSVDLSCIAIFTARVKTTIDIPESLLRKAKVHAAEHQTTLKELVVKGLLAVTDGSVADAEAEELRQQRVRTLLAKLTASNVEPMTPLGREEIYER